VVSRAQVLGLGLTDGWVQHQLKAQRWQRLHTGVYATFTGEPSWEARCWAALLRCGDGAALAGPTALHVWHPRMPGVAAAARQHDIVVAVDEAHRPRSGGGVEVWSVADLARHVHPARTPPLLRFDATVLLTASRAPTPDDAIATVADACQSRRTTPGRLLELLEEMPANLRLRRFLREVLADVATGAYSFLEVRYLRDVERPHELPTARRQRRVSVGRHPCFRDVEYLGLAVVVELDGRLGHEDFVSRADDMDRDTDTAKDGARTARIGYLQVMSRRCATAQRVADLLRLGGWTGQARRCGPGCSVA
jgi:hypothetical protein